MSWETVDGNSQRPRVSWVVPDHLREQPRHGRIAPSPPDPHAILEYVDKAISISEFAQATTHLSALFASSASPLSSSVSSSSSLSTSSGMPPSPLGSMMPLANLKWHAKQPLLSRLKVCKLQSDPPQQMEKSLHRDNIQDKIVPASRLVVPGVSDTEDVHLWGDENTDVKKLSDGNWDEQEKGKGAHSSKPGYDARTADEAYRAACSALSEGQTEMALSLLHRASCKCPPDRRIALGKVRRLTVAAMQLIENNSTVLNSLPVDKDAC